MSLRAKSSRPWETVINIKAIPNLNHISEDAGGLKIGALAKLEEIAHSPVVKQKYNPLAEAAQAANEGMHYHSGKTAITPL